MKVEIIGFAPSTYVRVVRMACEEKGVPYDLKPVPPHSPQVTAIHPFGKIPVFRDGTVELCESKAIATYLDRKFPAPMLIPQDPYLAALTEQWVSLVNTVIDRTMIRTYLFHYIFPKTADGKPDRAGIEAVTPELQAQIGILDKAVAKSGFLAGARFTFADINVMPILYYMKQMPESGEALAKARNLAAYYERNAARTSFTNTIPPPPPPRQAKPG